MYFQGLSTFHRQRGFLVLAVRERAWPTPKKEGCADLGLRTSYRESVETHEVHPAASQGFGLQ